MDKKHIEAKAPAFIGLFFLSALVLVAVLAMEYQKFQESVGAKSDTWYSASWLKSPVVNFMLSGNESREYWTTNAIGNQRWHVREVVYQGTTFWTTLSTEPV